MTKEVIIDLFEQWRVTNYGLESKDGNYFISRSRLGETSKYDGKLKEPISTWLVHMAEKDWVDYADFTVAFSCALALHRGYYDELSSDSYSKALLKGCDIQGNK